MYGYNGIVGRIIHYDSETSYAIFQLQVEDQDPITVKVYFPELHQGMQMTISGKFKTDTNDRSYLAPFICYGIPRDLRHVKDPGITYSWHIRGLPAVRCIMSCGM